MLGSTKSNGYFIKFEGGDEWDALSGNKSHVKCIAWGKSAKKQKISYNRRLRKVLKRNLRQTVMEEI